MHGDGQLYTVDGQIPMNVFTHWHYEQRFDVTFNRYVSNLFINGTFVSRVYNDVAREFQDVEVYLSLSPSADVLIKDFKYGPL